MYLESPIHFHVKTGADANLCARRTHWPLHWIWSPPAALSGWCWAAPTARGNHSCDPTGMFSSHWGHEVFTLMSPLHCSIKMVVPLQSELPQDLIFCQCRWFILLQISPQTRLSFLSLSSFYRGNFHKCYFNHAWSPTGNKVSSASQQRCSFPRITARVR